MWLVKEIIIIIIIIIIIVIIIIIIVIIIMTKTVTTIEMSCPWIENRSKKDEEKTLKYGPLRWELKAQYKGYTIRQINVIMDVLGGWSVDMEQSLRQL